MNGTPTCVMTTMAGSTRGVCPAKELIQCVINASTSYPKQTRNEHGVRIGTHRIHQVFRVSVILKGLHALTEIAGGIVLCLGSACCDPRCSSG